MLPIAKAFSYQVESPLFIRVLSMSGQDDTVDELDIILNGDPRNMDSWHDDPALFLKATWNNKFLDPRVRVQAAGAALSAFTRLENIRTKLVIHESLMRHKQLPVADDPIAEYRESKWSGLLDDDEVGIPAGNNVVPMRKVK